MKIIICGVTGNIGQQTLDVAKKFNHEIVGITFNSQHNKAKQIIDQLKIPYYFCHNDSTKSNVKDLHDLILNTKPQMVVNAISGYHGLNVSSLVLNHKIDLGLANKESMVIAGHWLKQIANKNKVTIYPIDSEHSTFKQLLNLINKNAVKNYLITASGGPFWGFSENKLKLVTLNQTLNHPTWKMGAKISIDSATLANKAFEIIEAFYFFNSKNIIPIRHKQSIIHAALQLKNNSYIFGGSIPDMRLAIQMCLDKYKNSNDSLVKPLNLINLDLSFEAIDENNYPLLKIAKDVIDKPASTRGAVFNVVNDFAVNLFMQKQINFFEITKFITNFYYRYKHKKISGIVSVYELINSLLNQLNLTWKDYL
ncbi:hypothetical protein [Mycoplasmoides alvi]|uniref:hypothetical protein n=1 Tax=Mycoplasmoides alvi TaxID=78580 RepID=UPI00051B5A11|nr:hypothetical protein [Mycoplasmoides alvi]